MKCYVSLKTGGMTLLNSVESVRILASSIQMKMEYVGIHPKTHYPIVRFLKQGSNGSISSQVVESSTPKERHTSIVKVN